LKTHLKNFDMNEKNILSQLQLTRVISQSRLTQLKAVEQAVIRLDCAGSSRDCRTISAVAIFLAYLGSRVEKYITSQIAMAFRAMEEMQKLPDQAQWEYRCAHTLGICEGLNRIGTIQAKIVEHAQASLQKAAVLLMVQGGKTDLPVTVKTHQDYIQSILQDLNPKQVKRLGAVNQQAVEFSRVFLRRSISAQSNAELTIATTCSAATDFISADILAVISNHASEAVLHGMYLDDPARGAKSEEYNLARLIAAGVVSALVIDLIKQNAPWVSVNLN
jgi:hypothetical protein